jgi:hypothetical protein
VLLQHYSRAVTVGSEVRAPSISVHAVTAAAAATADNAVNGSAVTQWAGSLL